MQTRFSKFPKRAGLLAILSWATLATSPRASAQTDSELELQLYAGLSITGGVGAVYSVRVRKQPVPSGRPRLALPDVPPTASHELSVV